MKHFKVTRYVYMFCENSFHNDRLLHVASEKALFSLNLPSFDVVTTPCQLTCHLVLLCFQSNGMKPPNVSFSYENLFCCYTFI